MFPQIRLAKRHVKEGYVGSSLQFTLTDTDPAKAEAFLNACAQRGVEIKCFGAKESIGFTSPWESRQYVNTIHPLPKTRRVLRFLCDFRIPLTFTLEDCKIIAAVIRQAAEEFIVDMNSRERVLTALNHEEPDRVPVDCGGRQTTFMVDSYENFKVHLGLEDLPTKMMSHKWQTVYVDEQILERFSIDCRHVRPPMTTEPELFETPAGETLFVDEWVVKRKVEAGYASIIEYPLQTAVLEDLEKYPWPDPAEMLDFSSIKGQAQQLYDQGEYAIVGCMGSPGNVFEQSWYLRGLTEFFMDLMDNKDFAHALLSKILEIRKRNAKLFLGEVGQYLDVIQLADDLAMQTGPYMSQAMYQEMIKPYQAELVQFVKELTPARIYYHSCGAVSALLDDLIDIGVEILNPVQVTATGMATDRLKKRFGKRLSFWGAIDTTEVLPQGTATEVKREVAKRIRELGPGGGYVLGSVHNMQNDIPPRNIMAMFEAAARFGKYPLNA